MKTICSENLFRLQTITQLECRSRVPLERPEEATVDVGENVKGARLVQTVGKTVGKGNVKGLGNILPKSRRRKVRRRQRIGAGRRIQQQVNIVMI